MNKQRPSFYAVIPASVRYDKDISSSEKLFYAEITAMSEKEGYCWASNSYFAELFDVSRNTITRWVGNLKDSGHVVVKHIKKDKHIVKREIYPINKIGDTYPQKSKGGTNKNDDTPTHKNGEDNTTRVNTTSNNSERTRVNGVDVLDGLESKEIEWIEKFIKYLQESHRIWQTSMQTELTMSTLLGFKKEGYDPIEIIKTVIQGNHKKLYKPDNYTSNGKKGKAKQSTSDFAKQLDELEELNEIHR